MILIKNNKINKKFFFFQFTPNPSWKKKNEKIKFKREKRKPI